MKKYTFGFSPCPNDTFIFYGMVEKRVDLRGLHFDFIIEDVETLNQLALSKKLDISKVSAHVYFYLHEDYRFLRSGAAFGYGCGPIVVSDRLDLLHQRDTIKIGVPGRLTTAFLLLKLFLEREYPKKSVNYLFLPFNKIMPAINEKQIDAGIVIHEGRFTYENYGLLKIVDLGQWWERETQLPIPLGGIIAKKEIGNDTIKRIEDIIIDSIKYSFSNPDENISFIKRYSQELTDEVIKEHISLYVNSYTFNIGADGWQALKELLGRAEELYSKMLGLPKIDLTDGSKGL
ncbi:MAG: 1,4-dihydroxy-6-naphthoate synthase [Thermodesulfovibrionales bacterium]|nr:1,4-dihydroxy-6-naphthoate synthase [Thermodesulfovibrionales bacterium]